MHRPPLAGLVVGLTTLLTALLVALAWPHSELGPRDVPVAVAGPAPAVEAARNALPEDSFDVTAVADRDAAETSIRERKVYGALVLSPSGAEVLTAPAASPAVAGVLTELAARVPGGPAGVTELVPLPASDPRGAVFGVSVLPLVLGGLATGVVGVLLTGRGAKGLLGLVAGVAVLGGLAVVTVLDPWLGVLRGDWWANAGVVALAIAAIALPVAGLGRTLGRAGLGLGVLTLLLLGNPLAGVTSAPELLPSGWGTLGQLLPPGAGMQALRSTSYFDAAGAGPPLLVLTGWLLLGLALLALPAGRVPSTEEGMDSRAAGGREPAAASA